MQRFCLALDLKPDDQLIKEYEAYHQKVWPEIVASIHDAGIEQLEIYRIENRLFMIIEAGKGFSLRKSKVGCSQPQRSGMGKPYVEIPTGIANCQARREMVDDGEDLRNTLVKSYNLYFRNVLNRQLNVFDRSFRFIGLDNFQHIMIYIHTFGSDNFHHRIFRYVIQ